MAPSRRAAQPRRAGALAELRPTRILKQICLLQTAWYAVVAFAFSSARPRAVYLRSKTWIDRTAAAVIGLLGARLIFESP